MLTDFSFKPTRPLRRGQRHVLYQWRDHRAIPSGSLVALDASHPERKGSQTLSPRLALVHFYEMHPGALYGWHHTKAVTVEGRRGVVVLFKANPEDPPRAIGVFIESHQYTHAKQRIETLKLTDGNTK